MTYHDREDAWNDLIVEARKVPFLQEVIFRNWMYYNKR